MFNPIKKWNDFLEKTDSFIKSVAAIGAIIFGVIIVSFCFASLPVKDSAVLFPVFGSMVGMAILMGGMFIQSNVSLKNKMEEYYIRRRNEDKAKELVGKNNQQETTINNQNDEIERLKRMRVDINSITPSLKLGLIELDCNLTDFYHKELSPRIDNLIITRRITNREYIGVIQASFTQKFGVDLEKLRFRMDSKKIIVSGYKSEFQGFQKWKTDRKIMEVREYTSEQGGKYVKVDTEAVSLANEQLATLMERIENGVNLRHIDEGVLMITKSFLSLILSPLLIKEIVFVEKDDKTDLGLIDFLKKHNDKIDSDIKCISDRTSIN